jgi:hypothetical protein
MPTTYSKRTKISGVGCYTKRQIDVKCITWSNAIVFRTTMDSNTG